MSHRSLFHTIRFVFLLTIGFGAIQAHSAYVVGSIPASFEVSQGVAQYTMPIKVAPGRAGMQPDLSLNYSSKTSNGILGLGWSLAGLSAIHRCTATIAQDGFVGGVNFDANDRFCLDGQRLVPVGVAPDGVGTEYRTEIDGYSRIVSKGGTQDHPNHWIVKTKAGQVFQYGGDQNATQNLAQGASSWSVREINDTTGNNPISFNYSIDQQSQYLSSISYPGGRVDFAYEARQDQAVSYLHGNRIVAALRLRSITANKHSNQDPLVYTTLHAYTITYEEEATATEHSRVSSIELCAANGDCFYPTSFDWLHPGDVGFRGTTESDICENSDQTYCVNYEKNYRYIFYADVDGDAITDVCFRGTFGIQCHKGTPTGFQNEQLFRTQLCQEFHLGMILDDPERYGQCGNEASWDTIQFHDFDFDGRSDVVFRSRHGIRIYRSTGTSFELFFSSSLCADGDTQHGHCNDSDNHKYISYADINGDARLDVCYRADQGVRCYFGSEQGFDLSSSLVTDICANGSQAYGGCDERRKWESLGFVDMTGDGMADMVFRSRSGLRVFRSTGYSFELLMTTEFCADGSTAYGGCSGENNHPYLHYPDMNADGLADFCFRSDSGIRCFINTGGAFDTTNYVSTSVCSNGSGDCDDAFNYSTMRFADVNADGKADLMYRGDYGFRVYLNSGDDFELSFSDELCGDGYAGCDNADNYNTIELIDQGGDGQLDIAYRSDFGIRTRGLGLRRGFEAISLINAGSLGALNIRINYAPLNSGVLYQAGEDTTFPLINVKHPQHVVASTRTAKSYVSYTYAGLRVHAQGRGSLGFQRVAELHHGSDKTMVTEIDHSAFPLYGNILSVEERYNGQLINRSASNYATDLSPNGVWEVFLNSRTDTSYELGYPGTVVTQVTTDYDTYDDYGNVEEMSIETRGGGEVFTKTTVSTYDNDTSGENWILGRVTSTDVTHESPGEENEVRSTVFTYYDGTGLLETTTIQDALDRSLSTETLTYNAYGQQTSVTVSATDAQDEVPGMGAVTYVDRVATTSYENGSVNPSSSCNALGQCESYTYHGTGWLHTKTNANQITTTLDYDGFGRVVREDRSDGTWTTSERDFTWRDFDESCEHYSYLRSHTGGGVGSYHCVRVESSDGSFGEKYFDAFDQELGSAKSGFDGKIVHNAIDYNDLGQVTHVSRDYYHGEQIYWSASEYDALGRVQRVTEPGPNGTFTEVLTEYRGLETTVITGPERRRTTTQTNALGKKVRITESDLVSTSYTYTSAGDLKTTTVAGDDATTVTLYYDSFGRKVAMDDPDMGYWEYTYTPFGELRTQTDARTRLNNSITGSSDVTVSMRYDVLGRMTHRYEAEGMTTWSYYGNDAPNGSIGQLERESAPGISRSFYYDSLGRAQRVSTNIGGEVFESRTSYDGQGRVERVDYPGTQNFWAQNVYDDQGFLIDVRGPRAQGQSYDYAALQPLISNATSLAQTYLDRADRYREIGEYYEEQIENYETLIERNRLTFTGGDTAGLNQGVPYELLAFRHRDNNNYNRRYIRVPDTVVLVGTEFVSPIVVPTEFHIEIIKNRYYSRIRRISVAEFNSLSGQLVSADEELLITGATTALTTFESDSAYHSMVARHQALLQETIATSAPEDSVPPSTPLNLSSDLLMNINDALVEMRDLQNLMSISTYRYEQSAAQLALLAEQTLAAADNAYRIVDTTHNVADVYQSYINDSSGNTMSFWRPVDVDASGRISAEVYGNGLVNDYYYEQSTGQLKTINTGLLASSPIRHLEYQYDAYQNVTLRHDYVNDIRERYEYDELDRLEAAHVDSDVYLSAAFNHTQRVNYDLLGNITYKSDVGNYEYGTPTDVAGPHAVVRAGNASYRYDANGNMESGDGRTMVWSSFNKPTQITQNGRVAHFDYGPDRARYRKRNHQGDETLYIGHYERLSKSDGEVEEKHTIYAGGQAVAERVVSNRTGAQTFYMHKDALGSVDLITGQDGDVVDRRSFDAWGKLRDMPWNAVASLNDPSYLTHLPVTNRGYTGHEHVQEVDLIHMNGRVYDASLGRFISADPHIQASSTSQSFNRYSYVMNNPLKYTDPSGYFFGKVVKEVRRALKKVWKAIKPYAGIIVGAAISIWCGVCGGAITKAMIAGAAAGAVGAAATGGNVLRGAVMGGLSGLVFGGIGQHVNGFGAKVLAHSAAGGVMSVLQGGKFGYGFMSAGFAKFSTLTMKSYSLFGMKDTSQSFGRVLQRTTVAAIVGGTASEIGGGKFANGAKTAAMAHLFNEESQNAQKAAEAKFKAKLSFKVRKWLEVGASTDGEAFAKLKGKQFSLQVDQSGGARIEGAGARIDFTVSDGDLAFLVNNVQSKFEFGMFDALIGVTDAGAISWGGSISPPGFWSRIGLSAKLEVSGSIDPTAVLRKTLVGDALYRYGRGTTDYVNQCDRNNYVGC